MLNGLMSPEGSFTLVVLCFVLFGTLGWAAIFVSTWFSNSLQAASRRSHFSRQRQQGLLDQSQSLPYLERDGGRGPGGGRYLLGPGPGFSACFLLMIAWLPAAISLAVATWMIVTAATEFLVLAAIASVACTLLAAAVSASVFPLQPYRVEVDPCPPAVGDLITIRMGQQGTTSKSKVQIRLLLTERVHHSQVGGINGWTEEVLWDEPFFQSETTLSPDWKYQVVVRIPDDKPGTYLAPGYCLEWIIEVRDRGHTERFPLPVVK